MKQITAIAALSVVGLLACEPVLQPEANSPNFHRGGGRIVLRSVKGHGRFTTFRTFAFSALEHPDGTVTGQWAATNEALGLRGRGAITCFTIVGNAAWIGGPIEAFPSDPDRVGRDAVWRVVDNGHRVVDNGHGAHRVVDNGHRVVDNGHGAHAAPDQISQFVQPGAGGASSHCLDTPNLDLNDLEAGDIQVREH